MRSILDFFFGISTYFYIENDGQSITFFIFKNLSKTLYFREKTDIIYLFLVQFQIRLKHMTVLLILHVTKEKNIKKVFLTTVRRLLNSTKTTKKTILSY